VRPGVLVRVEPGPFDGRTGWNTHYVMVTHDEYQDKPAGTVYVAGMTNGPVQEPSR
jgi:hypothetical protein